LGECEETELNEFNDLESEEKTLDETLAENSKEE
jgi:hypothetical protein